MTLSTLIQKAKEELKLIGGEETISYKIDQAEKLLALVGDIDLPETTDDICKVVSKTVGDDFSHNEIEDQSMWIDTVTGLQVTL